MSEEHTEVGLEARKAQGRPLASIVINGVQVEIHRGRIEVAEIKRVGGVPHADVLSLLVEGKLQELPDEGHVVIKGGEQFVS